MNAFQQADTGDTRQVFCVFFYYGSCFLFSNQIRLNTAFPFVSVNVFFLKKKLKVRPIQQAPL